MEPLPLSIRADSRSSDHSVLLINMYPPQINDKPGRAIAPLVGFTRDAQAIGGVLVSKGRGRPWSPSALNLRKARSHILAES